MSVEGVWKVEMLGPYGWEKVGTAFLKDGRYLGASADHYAIGSYEEDGDTIKTYTRMTQHGKRRAVFGGTKKHVNARMEGKIKKPDKIVGVAYPAENKKFDIRVRLTRLGDLD